MKVLMKNQQQGQRHGFTLLELLIVLAILGVLAAMVVPALLGRQKRANIQAAQASISGLEKAMKMYAADHGGEPPEGDQSVVTQLLQPSEINGQKIDPYLESPPRDPWGEMLYYEYPTTKTNGTRPAVWSAGPNRQNDQGQGDDINNWADQATL